MPEQRLTILLLPDTYAICRLHRREEIPAWALAGEFVSITRTPDELSVICPRSAVPGAARCEGEWRVLKVEGPLDFELVGVLASLATPLARAGIPIVAVATYDTDYVLVRSEDFERAVQALSMAGHRIADDRSGPRFVPRHSG